MHRVRLGGEDAHEVALDEQGRAVRCLADVQREEVARYLEQGRSGDGSDVHIVGTLQHLVDFAEHIARLIDLRDEDLAPRARILEDVHLPRNQDVEGVGHIAVVKDDRILRIGVQAHVA